MGSARLVFPGAEEGRGPEDNQKVLFGSQVCVVLAASQRAQLSGNNKTLLRERSLSMYILNLWIIR